jgi:formiminoglutamase
VSITRTERINLAKAPSLRKVDESLLQAPDAALFYSRGDANDPRLGEWACRDFAAYPDAQVALLGCPQDEGVQRNGGRPGAREAPTEIRRTLYRLTRPDVLAGLRLIDLGDVRIQPTLEETHAAQQALVRQVIADGKRLIVLGGGNDISYPDGAGLAEATGAVLAFNIDAHFDVRTDQPRNSGTPYRQLLAGGHLHPTAFYELGYQPFSNSSAYERELRALGVHLLSPDEWRAAGLLAAVQTILTAQQANSVFWGFDMDVVCAADAPGVSAPNPLGLRGAELCQLAALAGAEPRTRVVEFSEVNPRFDVDGRTSRLAAVAVWHTLVAFAGM